MDIFETLEELRQEREVLDKAIQMLESLEPKSEPGSGETSTPKRRGRISMSQEERLAVSKRMRAYWQKRRKK